MKRHSMFCAVLIAGLFHLLTLFSASGQDASREDLWTRGGFTPVFGGLGESAGITVGIRYDLFLRHPDLTLAGDALGSLRRYAGLRFLGGYEGENLGVYGYAKYRYMPREIFYGIGSGTDVADEADYRLDESLFGVTASLKVLDPLFTGMYTSYRRSRYGEGRASDVPPVDQRYDELAVPGLGQDAGYALIGWWVEIDRRSHLGRRLQGYRFSPVTPSLRGLALGINRGWYASMSAVPHIDLDGDQPNFIQVELEGQLFIPTGFDSDGFAFRSFLSLLSFDETPPFYELPAIGGASSIRGFRSQRFRDRNIAILNAEYRRALLLFLDAAFFVDAGQAFSAASEVGLRSAEYGYGAGLRLRVGRVVLGRLDLAHSREGFHVYLRAGTFL